MSMNQILISETLYVTPEIKRKKIIYKINFFIAIILMIVLFGYYAYAEYSRYKDQEESKQILESLSFNINNKADGNITLSDDTVRVVLNEEYVEDEQNIVKTSRTPEEEAKIKSLIEAGTKVAPSGDNYYSIGVISIPKIDLNYAILNKTTEELLKMSPTKFWGPDPNEIGNLCIAGHNYRNNLFFSKVPQLQKGDIIEIKDLLGNIIQYSIYDKFIVRPEDTSSTSQYTDGKREITLITCTNDSVDRIIIKAREVLN